MAEDVDLMAVYSIARTGFAPASPSWTSLVMLTSHIDRHNGSRPQPESNLSAGTSTFGCQ
jgi:hypothetical protein